MTKIGVIQQAIWCQPRDSSTGSPYHNSPYAPGSGDRRIKAEALVCNLAAVIAFNFRCRCTGVSQVSGAVKDIVVVFPSIVERVQRYSTNAKIHMGFQ